MNKIIHNYRTKCIHIFQNYLSHIITNISAYFSNDFNTMFTNISIFTDCFQIMISQINNKYKSLWKLLQHVHWRKVFIKKGKQEKEPQQQKSPLPSPLPLSPPPPRRYQSLSLRSLAGNKGFAAGGAKEMAVIPAEVKSDFYRAIPCWNVP